MADNQIIVDVATKLVQNNLEKVIKGIYRAGTSQYNTLKNRTLLSYNEYLAAAVNKYSFTKTILNRERAVSLYEFYINSELKMQEEIIDASDINNIINKYKFTTVYGSGGSGKSTLFKHLFLNTITKTDYIPIFVELRNLNETKMNLIDCMYKSLTDLKFSLEKKYFESSLKNGCFLILFDGLDEVEESRRESLINEIISLTDLYDNNRYIISSRHNDSIYNSWSKFVEFDLLPLDQKKAISLIKNLNYDEEIKTKFINKLAGNLYDRHKSFCSNPLLLNLMLLTFHEFAEIPEKVHIFYARAYDVLYSQHDATKSFKRKHRTLEDLGYDDFINVLSALSAFSYLDSIYSFDNPSLLSYIEKSKAITNFKFVTEHYKADLVESVSLLYLDGLKYKFQHRLFQEYFTARFIINLPDKKIYEVMKSLALKKHSSLKEDTVFDLVFEIEKQRIEKVFIIPFLKEIKDYITQPTKKNTYYKYLRGSFSSFGISYGLMSEEDIQKEEDAIVFTYRNKAKNSYIGFINYIFNKYNERYSDLIPSQPKKTSSIVQLKKFGVNIYGDLKIDLDNILTNTELLDEFLDHASLYIRNLDFSMTLLEKLESESSERDDLLSSLLKI